MDTILSGTVPIFTSLDQYDIQGWWIDWSKLSYYLPVHNYSQVTGMPRTKTSLLYPETTTQQDFLQGLLHILQDVEGYQKRQTAILENMELFDYTTIYPFDVYMCLLQAHLFPETRHASSNRWSALILPPPLFV